jgi:hypothetical protein
MALYSWFSHHNNKPDINTAKSKSKVLPSITFTRNIENYTMWPTAKIKQDTNLKFTVNDTFKTNNNIVIKTTITKAISNKQLFSFKVPLLINK